MYETYFQKLWDAYVQLNPKVAEIKALLKAGSPNLQNDHIALRTLAHPAFGMDQLISEVLDFGYHVQGQYHFKEKKLDAVHLEHINDAAAPKIFISELRVQSCSDSLRTLIEQNIVLKAKMPHAMATPLACSGRHWGTPSFEVYEQMLAESEYAAWFYVFGFMPNHFTVKVNTLDAFEDIYELNAYLEQQGIKLNASGGKIKGSPELMLEQSSTMADLISVQFQEGQHCIPSVFYEFAKRYLMPDGREFSAFIEGNADKIFESTHVGKTQEP